MLNNILNAMALTIIVAIACAAVLNGAPLSAKGGSSAVAVATAASAPGPVVQLPAVVVVGHRDRTLAAAR